MPRGNDIGGTMTTMKTVVITIAICAVVVIGCQPVAEPEHPRDRLAQDLQSLLDDAVAKHEGLPAIALHVEAPGLDFSWGGAAGLADPTSGTPMTPEHPVLVASNTKTFISASILRLWEEGRLGLDDPMSAYVSDDHLEILRGDGYRVDEISLRHLLTHTSGLFDYADSEAYSLKIEADLMHRWTRTEQLQGAVDWGDPYGAPGEVYRYCDTGYILLGEIIERVTGQTMPVAVRELVGYEGLGLGSTWFETLEPRPEGVPDLAHQYEHDLDSYAVDPSEDLYGGGGLASTVGDLARFMRGIFTGGVFSDPETAVTMLTTVEVTQGGPDAYGEAQIPGGYRMGVVVEEVDGLKHYRHGGWWGTTAAYVPELDAAFACAVNRRQELPVRDDVMRGALALIRDAMDVQGDGEHN
jgi:D-alanyl-D-alanine carboxypeptidase